MLGISTGESRELGAILYGTIHPTNAPLSFQTPFTANIGGELEVQIIVVGGHFQALALDPVPSDPSAIATLVNRLAAVVQGVVDAYTFLTGRAYIVEVDGGFAHSRAIFLDQRGFPLAVGLDPTPDQSIEPETMQRYTGAALNVSAVRLALADISSALRQPADSGFYAYRAIESMRLWYQDQEPRTDDRAEGWKRLRDDAAIRRDELDALVELARSRRHGAEAEISEVDRITAIQLARRAVEKVVEHVASGPAVQDESEQEPPGVATHRTGP